MSQCSALWIAKKLLLASWGLKLECSQSMSSIAAIISLSLCVCVGPSGGAGVSTS